MEPRDVDPAEPDVHRDEARHEWRVDSINVAAAAAVAFWATRVR